MEPLVKVSLACALALPASQNEPTDGCSNVAAGQIVDTVRPVN